jgi:hypothetical protein
MPTTSRVPIVWSLPGWNQLPILVEGGSYYQYSFWALDVPAARVMWMFVQGQGDLDGDGVVSLRSSLYQGIGYSFTLNTTFPLPGVNEDIF